MINFPTSLVITVIALGFVIAFAWLTLKGIASMGISKNKNGRLQVIESVIVGSKERVVLVRCDGNDYMLGVSNGSVSCLDKFESTLESSI